MTRFTSLPQAVGFVRGRLTGLANTTRYGNTELSRVVREELKEIEQLLAEAVRTFDETPTKTTHVTK